MTTYKKVVGGYADSVWYGLRNSSGIFVGSTATVPAAGNQDGSALAQLGGVQDFPLQILDPSYPSQPGDGGTLARFINKPTELPQTTANFGAMDMTFAALATTMLTFDVGGGAGVLTQPYNPTFRDMVMLAISPGKAQDTGYVDTSIYECDLWFNVNCYPKFRNSYQTGTLPTYSVGMIANYGERLPWGTALAAGTHGDTKAAGLHFTWPYRPILQCWQLNGTEVTFNLAKNIALDAATNLAAFTFSSAGAVQALTWATGVPGSHEFGITESTTDTIVLHADDDGAALDYLIAIYGWV
jgi:hypothetical protein